jgi:methionyl-tRNA synthetase
MVLAKAVALLGSFITMMLLIKPETHVYIWITAPCAFISELLQLFAVDKDGNGIVDWFEWKKFLHK